MAEEEDRVLAAFDVRPDEFQCRERGLEGGAVMTDLHRQQAAGVQIRGRLAQDGTRGVQKRLGLTHSRALCATFRRRPDRGSGVPAAPNETGVL